MAGKKNFRKKARKPAAKKPLRAVAKQNQARTELKSRVVAPDYSPDDGTYTYVIPTNGSISHGPTDSVTVVPRAYYDGLVHGSANGQLEGLFITPKFLTMKMELNFDQMFPTLATSGTITAQTPISYKVIVNHGWIKQDLRPAAVSEFSDGGARLLAAIESTSIDQGTLLAVGVARHQLFLSQIQPDYLTFRRKDPSNVVVIKKQIIRPKGNMLYQYQTSSQSGAAHEHAAVAPNAQIRLSWDMKDIGKGGKPGAQKMRVMPIVNAGSLVGFTPGNNWIPYVNVSCEYDKRGAVTHAGALSAKNGQVGINYTTMFTYADV